MLPPRKPTDNQIAEAGDRLDLGANRSLDDKIVEAAREYRHVAELFAARDPDTGEAVEATAYDKLADLIRVALNEHL
jgi:hypothetical protein